jgi:hypothetical protein
MSRDCADLNICLKCNKPVGFKSEGCNCICHIYSQWEDGYGNMHFVHSGIEETFKVRKRSE